MKLIPIGAKGSFAPPESLVNRFKGAIRPAVCPNGLIIMQMENAALNAVKAYLDAGEITVGTAVNVRHPAVMVVASQVMAEAEVTNVVGRHIEFTVRAKEGAREIGLGTHERAVIDDPEFARRLAEGNHGKPFSPTEVGQVQPGSAAERGGLQAGDVILSIDGSTVERFEEVQHIVRLSPGVPMAIVVRRDGHEQTLHITPSQTQLTDRYGNRYQIGLLGITRPALRRS
jgi:fluoroacetyl-CoA thioesterase